MTTTGPQVPPPTPITPPTDAGAIPTRQSTWPTVIGVIAIIFGSLATLQGCIGLGSSAMFGLFASAMPEEQAGLMDATKSLTPLIMISGGLTMAIAIVLLIGGIGLTRRSPRGPKTCRIWAGLKMLIVVYGSIIGYLVQQAQMEAMQRMLEDNPNTATAMPGFFGPLMAILGPLTLVFGIVWGWALPIFMLIWFSRRKIKAEVAQWRHPVEAMG
ncbi:MAG: hypothetical protein V3T53_09775 [Phycisphaerales bacterium]